MKKASITVTFDAEKMKAINLYMNQKELSVETELIAVLELLFQKHVPANVRSFLEMCADSSGTRRIRPPTSAVGGEQS